MVNEAFVELGLLSCQLAEYNVLVAVRQVAFALHLLLCSPQNMSLYQLPKFLSALLRRFLLEQTCALVPTLDNYLTEFLGEKIQISKQTWLHVRKKRPELSQIILHRCSC